MGASLVVQWLRLHAPSAGALGSIPGWEARFPHTATMTWCSQINKRHTKRNLQKKKKNLRMELLCEPALPPLGIYSEEFEARP